MEPEKSGPDFVVFRLTECPLPDCTNPANHKCPRCLTQLYCSENHREAHWPQHKSYCSSFVHLALASTDSPMSPACDFSVINHNINTKFIVELKFLNEGQRAVPQPFNSHRFVNITSVADVWDMPLHWDASVEANNYPSLFSLQTWDCIPSFAIVTGKNGEGKSQLLRYIRDLEGKDNGRVYFQSPTVSFVDDGRPQFRTLPLFEDNNYWDSFYNALFRMVRNLSVKKNPILNSFFFRYVVEYSRTARLEGFSIEVLRQIGALQLKKLVNDLKLRSADKLWSVIVSSFSEKKRSCLPPWDLFNKALTEVGFGYHIEVTNSSWILKSNQGSGIAFNQLSTGQQIIFSVLSILHFPVQLDDYERDPLKLMLLDEPDKHLDPENCKKFLDVLIRLSNEHSIQVIMTTHRIDLISLAPPDSLFSLGNRQISPCSHLLSYLRMTKNARELTPFTVKVYVEAPTDARFYVSIYNILRMYSDRERKQNSSQLFWSKTGWISRVLSNRFPLEILSAAIGDGGSGGKVAVKGTLAREFHAVNSQQHLGRTRSILSSPNLKFPFGIIDKDYFNTKAQSGLSKSEEWNILILERYAIENYLLDPYLVCSVLIPSEIDQIHDPVIRNALLRNGDFAEYFNHLIYLWFRKANRKHLIQSVINMYVDILVERLLVDTSPPVPPLSRSLFVADVKLKSYDDSEIKNIVNTVVKDLVKVNCESYEIVVQHFFGTPKLKNLVHAIYKCAATFPVQLPDFTPFFKTFEDLSRTEFYLENVTYVNFQTRREFDVSYPKIFFYLSGHELEKFVEFSFLPRDQSTNVEVKLKEYVLRKLEDSPEIAILPQDLILKFFEMNSKVRFQMNTVIKRNELVGYSDLDLDQKGYLPRDLNLTPNFGLVSPSRLPKFVDSMTVTLSYPHEVPLECDVYLVGTFNSWLSGKLNPGNTYTRGDTDKEWKLEVREQAWSISARFKCDPDQLFNYVIIAKDVKIDISCWVHDNSRTCREHATTGFLIKSSVLFD